MTTGNECEHGHFGGCGRPDCSLAVEAAGNVPQGQPSHADPRLGGSKSGWIWFGYAGHLVVGKKCAFHLATYMPEHKLLVSTVGHYLPDGKTMGTIGSGDEDFYETMVFACDGILDGGDPNIANWDSLDSRRYVNSLSAEKGHYEMLAEMDRVRTN